jgi:glycosyltransferase involved in cell wall biosynthesis
MKIIQVVSQMEAGGAQRVASLLAAGLRDRGHHTQLWFLYKKRPAYEEDWHTQCLCSSRPSRVAWLGLATRLWQKLRDAQPDVMLAHTHSANVFAAPIAAMAGVPVRIAVHHNPIETYPAIARVADGVAFKAGCYSTMVTVSGGVRESFADHSPLYRSRLHRIYNGVKCSPVYGSDNIRVEYRIPEPHAVLASVGRLAAQKNQRMLFRTLKELPDATLLLVGEGELGAELRRAASFCGVADRVRFTGELPAQEVSAILSQADLFLLPSLYESFCLAAVEAMHHGLPVIASDLPCLREVLGDGQIFFPVEDQAALNAVVKRLLNAPLERAAMGAAGRARAEQFTVERMVSEYECLMAEAMLYGARHTSAANNLRRFNALGGVPGVHDQL